MTGAQLRLRCSAAIRLLACTALVFLGAGCSAEDQARDEGGSFSSVSMTPPPSGATQPSQTADPLPSYITSSSPGAPIAVVRGLDEVSRTLRDLTKASNSREVVPAMAEALGATRSDLKKVRSAAYGQTRSCVTVRSAVGSARSNAVKTAAIAKDVTSRNAARADLLSRAKKAVATLSAATTANGRIATPTEKAALTDARAALAGAEEQLSRTDEAASDAVKTTNSLVAAAESIQSKAC